MQRNNFCTYRTYRDYAEVFDPGTLTRAVKRINGPDKVWIDAGAGGGDVLRGQLKRRQKVLPNDRLPRLIAYGYAIPKEDRNRARAAEASSGGHFQYRTGELTPRNISRLEKADLITDIGGLWLYWRHDPVKLIKAYVNALKPGGAAFIDSGAGHNGQVKKWLDRQPGITYELNEQYSTVVIRRAL